MADLSSFISTINNIIKGINENVVNPIQSGVSEFFGTPEPDSEISYIPEDIPAVESNTPSYTVSNVSSYELPTQEDINTRNTNNSTSNYHDALKIINSDNNDGAVVPSLLGSDMLSENKLPVSLQFSNLENIKNDYLQREAEQGQITPSFNMFNSSSFDQAQRDFFDRQDDNNASVSIPNIDLSSFIPKLDEQSFLNLQQDFNNRLADQPVFDVSLPSTTDVESFIQSFNDAKQDLENKDDQPQQIDFKNLETPSLNRFDQAQRDFFSRQPEQNIGIDLSAFNIPSIDIPNFDQAQRDFFSRQPDQNVSIGLPNINIPSIDISNFDQAQRDFFDRQSNNPTIEFPEVNIGNQEQIRGDFYNRQAEQTPKDFNLDLDNLNSIRQDYLSREANPPQQIVPEINIPSLDSIMQLQGDFFDREQQQKIDSMKRPGVTQGEDLDRYQKFFEEHGGLQDDYVTADKDIADSLLKLSLLNNSVYDRGEISGLDAYGDLVAGLDKMSNENFDDGTMRRDSVKSKYMSLPEYKEYVKAGFGGRSLEELDKLPEGSVFNKLDEARDYGFRPYIEDEAQFTNWMATQASDDMTKAFNAFGDIRNLLTDAKVNYGDESYSRKNLLDNARDYFKNIDEMKERGEMEILSPDDPRVDKDTDLPMTVWWSFPGTDVEIPSDQELQYLWSDDGSKLYVWLPGHEDQAVEYYGKEDYDAHLPEWKTYRSEEGDPVHSYWRIPKLEYTQDDGTQVSLPYSAVEDMAKSMAEGTADMDWGPLNIAKDRSDRKDFEDMISTMDFSDIVPNMVDLAAGSAPLFTSMTAWPMAIANAGTSSQGLDPRLWDSDTNTYRRLSDDMTGEKYLSNIALSGLVPATEKVAGVIGGGGGLIGKPIQSALKKIGAPAAARSAVDVLGEGVEESVASAWEDYQVNGLGDWFADPVYKTDDNGNVLTEYNPATGQEEPIIDYDVSGHEKRDSNTPFLKRLMNFGSQQPENFFPGVALGMTVGGPGIAHDAITGSGYYAESRERKLLRDLEKLNNLPHFREAKRGNTVVTIRPEDIGSYGKKE